MEYKYEMHCHTKIGSRQCGRMMPKDIAKLYIEKGYSGIVVTDHYSPLTFSPFHGYFAPQTKIDNYIAAYEEFKKYESDDFSVMFGIELRHYATANDYLIYGMDENWLRKQGNLLAVWEREMYELMHSEGYLVFQAHPYRPGIKRCNPDYIDGVEIYNGKSTREQNESAYAWAKQTGKLMISGSDFHVPKNLARGGIITNKKISNNADLLDMIKSQDFKMIQNY